MDRVINFSAGPAALPLPVLQEVQQNLLALPGCGASILEISHRSPQFIEILESAQSRLRELLGIGSDYEILFLQGGSRLQFSMVPLNLLGSGTADYVVTGSWSKLAFQEAARLGSARVAWDGGDENYCRLPREDELQLGANAAYLYVTSNETIQGVQLPTALPWARGTLVCDASSDFLSRPIPVSDYGLIYACAQKNAGPAGVTVAIVRRDLLDRAPENLPGYLDYREHANNNSLYNTPPTFAIYVVELVLKWLQEEVGGLERMAELNSHKAQLVYDLLDESEGFYRGHAEPACRSRMNATFRLPTPELEADFAAAAKERGLTDLKGHRSVGGIRVSMYNAVPLEGVQRLCQFMTEFRGHHA